MLFRSFRGYYWHLHGSVFRLLPLLKCKRCCTLKQHLHIIYPLIYHSAAYCTSHEAIKPRRSIRPEYHFTAAVSTDFHKTILIIIEKNLIAKRHNVKQAVKTFRISPAHISSGIVCPPFRWRLAMRSMLSSTEPNPI